MKRIQVYLGKDEMQALCEAAARSGRTVTDVVREAIREAVLKSTTKAKSPIAIWHGRPKSTSINHDSVHDRCW